MQWEEPCGAVFLLRYVSKQNQSHNHNSPGQYYSFPKSNLPARDETCHVMTWKSTYQWDATYIRRNKIPVITTASNSTSGQRYSMTCKNPLFGQQTANVRPLKNCIYSQLTLILVSWHQLLLSFTPVMTCCVYAAARTMTTSPDGKNSKSGVTVTTDHGLNQYKRISHKIDSSLLNVYVYHKNWSHTKLS